LFSSPEPICPFYKGSKDSNKTTKQNFEKYNFCNNHKSTAEREFSLTVIWKVLILPVREGHSCTQILSLERRSIVSILSFKTTSKGEY
jgi:hypothetical protein